jgi:hypothetical protein
MDPLWWPLTTFERVHVLASTEAEIAVIEARRSFTVALKQMVDYLTSFLTGVHLRQQLSLDWERATLHLEIG